MNILRRVEPFLPPLVGGLLIVVVLIGLIGTAIRNPQPHDIPVGLVGPAPAVQQISSSFATAAPAASRFATYAPERYPWRWGGAHHRLCARRLSSRPRRRGSAVDCCRRS